MKKVIITALLVSSLAAFSQTYKSAIGAKLGHGLVASYKYMFSKPHAVEAFAGFTWYGGGFIAGASYQYHIMIPDVKGLSVPLGAGAMFGAYNNLGFASAGVIAVTGNVGLEYAFSDIPLSLGLEYMPAFALNGGYGYFPGFGALNVRYILGRK
ncbi:MAG: hypothetical protein EAZ53_12355 [Bacteroidetes bacterium]|nr:MAG: hypothetical protein EAZ53_12355 [Bacteroidota bacterium]